MRSIPLLALALVFSVPLAAQAQVVAFPDSASQVAAESWLALVDSTRYAESWESAAPGFQQQVTPAQWSQAVAQARGQLGSVQDRVVQAVQQLEEVPGLPRGNYMVVEYATRFSQMPRVSETHLLVLGEDGIWRTGGYFVRPAQ